MASADYLTNRDREQRRTPRVALPACSAHRPAPRVPAGYLGAGVVLILCPHRTGAARSAPGTAQPRLGGGRRRRL